MFSVIKLELLPVTLCNLRSLLPERNHMDWMNFQKPIRKAMFVFMILN